VTIRYEALERAPYLFCGIIVAGVVASLVDSILGATVQAQYQCPVCGKTTEKQQHCQASRTILKSGLRFVDNDVVNAFCAFSGAVLSWLIWKFLT